MKTKMARQRERKRYKRPENTAYHVFQSDNEDKRRSERRHPNIAKRRTAATLTDFNNIIEQPNQPIRNQQGCLEILV